MDYEKKHKEEVVRATQLWECGDITRENLEYIFPELAESDDERIRKRLICGMNALKDQKNETFAAIPIDDCIAWLEKQGKHKDYYTKQELIDMGFSFTLNGDIVTPDKMMEDMKKYLAWHEKQGEKPIFEFKANNWYVSKVDGKIHDMTYIPNAVEQSKWSENDEDGKVNDETNAPTGYGKYVNECLNEASKHFFSDGEDKYSVADLFYAGVRCGKSWFEKQAPKSKWSEEDVEIVSKLQCTLDHVDYDYDTHKKLDNWLKSIEQRMEKNNG